MPYLELLPFLRLVNGGLQAVNSACQCPISSYSHFYAQKTQVQISIVDECQCPISSYSHFYVRDIDDCRRMATMCQCPISSYSHFYRVATIITEAFKDCVNALSRATPISTKKEHHFKMVAICVNALSRATPISTILLNAAIANGYFVSMPYLELLPFLPSNTSSRRQAKCVSMPYLELLPFLPGSS